MTTAREFQDVESDYDVLEEFFSDAFEFKGKQRYELGRTTTIYDIILKNYRRKFGVDVSEAMAEKIDVIDSYQVLEDIQFEIWSAPSPEAYERGVEAIIKRHAEN